jgi:hypothetical protein
MGVERCKKFLLFSLTKLNFQLPKIHLLISSGLTLSNSAISQGFCYYPFWPTHFLYRQNSQLQKTKQSKTLFFTFLSFHIFYILASVFFMWATHPLPFLIIYHFQLAGRGSGLAPLFFVLYLPKFCLFIVFLLLWEKMARELHSINL